jgi:hypothetical protein
MMTEPDLNFIAEQLKRVLSEQASQRADIAAMRTEMNERLTDLSDGQTVLGQMIMRLERDMVRVKDLLGKMDGRIARLEQAVP